MHLTNIQKDIIGSLRAINWIVLMWKLPRLRFPLASRQDRIMRDNRNRFEELAGRIKRLSYLEQHEAASSLDSSLDDISPRDASHDNADENDMFLSLYAKAFHKKEKKIQNFSYSNKKKFYDETKPIFFIQLVDLVFSVACERYLTLKDSPGRALESPEEDWTEFFRVLHDLVPRRVGIPGVRELMCRCFRRVRQTIEAKPPPTEDKYRTTVLKEIENMIKSCCNDLEG